LKISTLNNLFLDKFICSLGVKLCLCCWWRRRGRSRQF